MNEDKSFINELEKITSPYTNNTSITENGAIGYKSTNKAIIDFLFKISSYRETSIQEIKTDFSKVLKEEPLEIVLKFIFYIRDIRINGLGERKLFKILFLYLMDNDEIEPNILCNLIKRISFHGRWDDIIFLYLELLNKNNNDKKFIYLNTMRNLILSTLKEDKLNMANNKPITLLAKWVPSINSKNKNTSKKGFKFLKSLKLSKYHFLSKHRIMMYRTMISSLRKYLDITEIKMSSKKWNEIDYSKVPGKAMLIYKNAFRLHDECRYENYLESLKNGETKINAGTLFPYEVINKYYNYNGLFSVNINNKIDEQLEQTWKALTSVKPLSSTLVIRDGSGSMYNCVNNIVPNDIATSLAIYTSEYNEGIFKNKFITFSSDPKLIDLTWCNSLLEKIKVCINNDDCTNTNIESVFDLILSTAIKGNLTQEQLPKNILIVSDMEFDNISYTDYDKILFNHIKEKFTKNNYKIPKLIFWNVCSRTKTIPVVKNELGLILISGFSQNTLSMVTNGELDTYKALLKELEKYDDIII